MEPPDPIAIARVLAGPSYVDQGLIARRPRIAYDVVGLHTGEALVSEGGYVGHDVHKAKRIEDAGHGGQILLSRTTNDLLAGHLPPDAHITDLGPHRLKDLGEPQHVFQLSADGLPSEFPHLRTLDVGAHNLPVQLTSFVGRERELEEVARMLASSRLVTLMGVGGCGKTRLATHAAAAELETSSDGVFFCDLSRLSDEDALLPAVARTLELDSGTEGLGAMPPAEAVRRYLARRRVLLILDNCEHLVDAVAELAEDLLTSSTNLRILATSREALEVDGEHAWSVPSLPAADEGTRLFAERAAAVPGGFTLSYDNAKDVRAICERLDGMPLAIELAAAQIAHLGPRQIAERLDNRFKILTGGRRRVQRQQTLQASMEWSWDLLDERDQMLLRRLSVFQGGCTLEAAEEACGEGLDVVAGLRSLVAESLVVAEELSGAVRYRLLETVRLYAEDKLAASGEGEELRERHRDHYLAWAEAFPLEETLFGGASAGMLELEQEEDNIRASLRWSESQERFDLAARLLCSTSRLWNLHGEAPARFQRALEADLPPELRGPLLAAYDVAGWFSRTATRATNLLTFLDPLDEAIELMAGGTSPWLFTTIQTKAQGVCIQALVARDQSLADEAVALADQSIALGRSIGDFWEGMGHGARGSVLLMQLRHLEALQSYTEVCRKITPDGRFLVPTLTRGARRAATSHPRVVDARARVRARRRHGATHRSGRKTSPRVVRPRTGEPRGFGAGPYPPPRCDRVHAGTCFGRLVQHSSLLRRDTSRDRRRLRARGAPACGGDQAGDHRVVARVRIASLLDAPCTRGSRSRPRTSAPRRRTRDVG